MMDLLFSGVKPTSIPHLGNYIGALKQWTVYQHEYKSLFCVVDLHAITVPQEPAELKRNILDIAATYLAIGLLPERCTFFVQSEVSEHAELGWILGTIAKLGEMERMTQFKDKSAKGGRERAGLGLFSYPALMAADILLYDTTVVPVGEDQIQHIELTRLLARRFNERFGETFVLPQPLIQKVGARIMSLSHPEKKMSKSDADTNGTISLLDDADTIQKKIMRAVTDSGSEISYNEEARPAISNLLAIYHHLSGKSIRDIESKYRGKGYGDFKKDLAEVVIEHLSPISARIHEYREHPEELQEILDRGREAAHKMAQEKMKVVKEKMGLGRE